MRSQERVGEPRASQPPYSTRTVPVGSKPHSLAVDTATNKIYVANSDSITIIDGATNSTTTVAAGTKPGSPVVDSSANKVYVANFVSNDVTVIDGSTNNVTAIPVGIHPHDPAINSKTNKVYVPNGDSETVSVIDGRTNKTHTVRVGKSPFAIAVNEVTDMIYVSCGDSKNVAVIDGRREKATSFVENVYWEQLAVDPDRNLIYTAGMRMLLDRDEVQRFLSRFSADPWKSYADHIAETIPATVIDGRSNISRDIKRVQPSLSLNPKEHGSEFVHSIVIDPLTHKAYMTMTLYLSKNQSSHLLAVDALTNQMQEIPVGSGAWGIGLNPVTNKIYVANSKSNTVSVVDGATNESVTIEVGQKPSAVIVNTVTNKIYVANQGSNTVSVIDGASVPETR